MKILLEGADSASAPADKKEADEAAEAISNLNIAETKPEEATA